MGLPYVLPVVKEVEIIMAKDMRADHEALSPLGLSSFRKAATELVLGKDCLRNLAGQVSAFIHN